MARQETTRQEALIRILATDIPGNMKVYSGLTRIKGVSWALSNAICIKLNLNRDKRVADLTDQELKQITEAIKAPQVPEWLLNRRFDFETGKSRHLIVSELDLQREFDIRRLKKIKTYRGVRHALGQPTRGQRTRGHFRKGTAVGVTRAKVSSKKQ